MRIMSRIKIKCLFIYHIITLRMGTAFMKDRFRCHFRSLHLYQPLHIYRYMGKYIIGGNVQFGYDIGGGYRFGSCELQCRDKDALVSIGNNTAINNNFYAAARRKIVIGEYCRIGANCQIMDSEAHSIDPQKRSIPGEVGEVHIGDNVWIGNNVIILKNSKIGQNSIIAAGAVVCGTIPDNVVAGGVPAKIIKYIPGD